MGENGQGRRTGKTDLEIVPVKIFGLRRKAHFRMGVCFCDAENCKNKQKNASVKMAKN